MYYVCQNIWQNKSSWKAKWSESFEKLQRDQDRPGSRYYNYPPVSSPSSSQTPFYQKIILKIKKMMPKNNFPFYVPLNQPFLFILTVMFAFTFRCLRSHDYFKITGSEFWKRDSNFVRVTMSRHEPFLL